jgi:hypothetical protein
VKYNRVPLAQLLIVPQPKREVSELQPEEHERLIWE